MQQNKIIILALILIFLCTCVAFFSGLGLGFGLGQEIETFTANSEETVTEEPGAYQSVERPAQKGQLLLEDDFGQPQWEVYDDGDHRKGYEEGQYFIVVEVEEFSYWSIAGKSLTDFILEVETTQVSGPDDNDYGLILRHQDDENFYSFEISGDGYYTFDKLVAGELFDIIPWQESETIRRGNDRNTLRVEAIGPNFSFYINDELVDAAIDSEFSQGDIGLVAGAYGQAGVYITFDNLKVWAVSK
jgi:hypothetical protein